MRDASVIVCARFAIKCQWKSRYRTLNISLADNTSQEASPSILFTSEFIFNEKAGKLI